MLEVGQDEAVVGDDVLEEAGHHGALVASIHQPAGFESQKPVCLILALGPIFVGLLPELVVDRFAAQPAEGHGLEGVRRYREGGRLQVALQRLVEPVRMLLLKRVAVR